MSELKSQTPSRLDQHALTAARQQQPPNGGSTEASGLSFRVVVTCMAVSTALNLLAVEAMTRLPGTHSPHEAWTWAVPFGCAIITVGLLVPLLRVVSLLLACLFALAELFLALIFSPLFVGLAILGGLGDLVYLIVLSIPVHAVCVVAAMRAATKALRP